MPVASLEDQPTRQQPPRQHLQTGDCERHPRKGTKLTERQRRFFRAQLIRLCIGSTTYRKEWSIKVPPGRLSHARTRAVLGDGFRSATDDELLDLRFNPR